MELADRGKIKELFDIHCSYPTQLSKILEVHNEVSKETKRAFQQLIKYGDIYTECLKYNGVEVTTENRNKIKPYFNKLILSTQGDIVRLKKSKFKGNDPVLYNYVLNYMMNVWNEVFNVIWDYKTHIEEYIDRSGNIRTRHVKNLCHDLQKIETAIISKLRKTCQYKTIEIFDAIYCGEKDFNLDECKRLEIEFEKILNLKYLK